MVKDNEHVLIGDTPQEIANNIVKVIKSPKLAESIAKNARKHVEKYFDYASITDSLDEIYSKTVSKNEKTKK